MKHPLLRGWKVRVGLAICLLVGVLALVGPALNDLLGIDPNRIDYDALGQSPGSGHLLGTTSGGQDVLAQVVAGTRGSVLVGVVGAVIGTSLAVVFGVVSGFVGGRTDQLLSFVTNLFLVMPVLPLILVVAGYVRGTGPLMIALIIGVFGWAGGARILRAQTLTLRAREFVVVMKMLGESRLRLMFREVLPHLSGLISAMFLHMVIGAVLAEAGLAFLGISSADTVSWGTMIDEAQKQGGILNQQWWWFLPPGLCIALLGTATGLVNFGIDEVTNPRLSTANRSLVKRHRRALARRQAA
ncbi:ABC transporter permease [Streptomyces formicae]|uniref:ABC transporter permease n=1 Tax=Streptomyces formicae TaxID=1616117 RepID=A0ABY3WQ04_9ACTN|nr:ABC transporter permease [Streptomyces formicae]UNM12620.1 ABC transporter permease [Streptomyces formicae]